MNILALNWEDLSNPQAGGAEVHLQEILKRIASKGHQITLLCSGFADCKVGDKVNLEKAMTPSGRLGGHLVSGHVDGVGEVLGCTRVGRAIEYWIKAPDNLARYIAEKGSISVDGISLTVNDVDGARFKLTIVPHTAEQTTIVDFRPGRRVNLEVDQIARYLERLMAPAFLEGDSNDEESPVEARERED